MANNDKDLKYVEKYRRQREKMRALLEMVDEKKDSIFTKTPKKSLLKC